MSDSWFDGGGGTSTKDVKIMFLTTPFSFQTILATSDFHIFKFIKGTRNPILQAISSGITMMLALFLPKDCNCKRHRFLRRETK